MTPAKCCATIPQRIYQVSISFSHSDLMKKNLSKSHFILLTPSHRKNRREKKMFAKWAGAGFELSTAKINNTLSTNLTPQSTDPDGFLQPPAVCSLSGLRQPAGHILIWAQLKQLISFSSTIQNGRHLQNGRHPQNGRCYKHANVMEAYGPHHR